MQPTVPSRLSLPRRGLNKRPLVRVRPVASRCCSFGRSQAVEQSDNHIHAIDVCFRTAIHCHPRVCVMGCCERNKDSCMATSVRCSFRLLWLGHFLAAWSVSLPAVTTGNASLSDAIVEQAMLVGIVGLLSIAIGRKGGDVSDTR